MNSNISDTLIFLPSLEIFHQYANEIVNQMPTNLNHNLESVSIKIENFAHQQILSDLKIEDRYELLGLYKGVPIPVKILSVKMEEPDTIYLYRCPLIKYSMENDESLFTIVERVIKHEISHHFGVQDIFL
jgi:predicted Zn-dependent protease with MMP-like domain